MLKVLLVDDEKEILNGMQYIIDWEETGFKIVALCTNGIEAIQAAKNELPHLIITDIRMPEVSGLDLIKELKEVLPETKFIVLSGYDEFEYAKKSISFGVSNYLLKPVDEEELENALKKIKTTIEKEEQDIITRKRLEKRVRDAQLSIRLGLLSKLINSSSVTIEQEEKEIIKKYYDGISYQLIALKPLQEAYKKNQILPITLLNNNDLYKLNINEWVVLVIFDAVNRKTLTKQLRNAILTQDKNLYLSGTSPVSYNLLEIRELYTELIYAIEEEMFFSGSNTLELNHRVLSTPGLNGKSDLEEILLQSKSLLKEHLFSIDKSRVSSIFYQFSDYVAENRGKISILEIKASYVSLLSYVRDLFIDSFNIPLEQLNELSSLIISISDVKSMNELLLRSKKGVLNVLNYIINQKTENTDELVKYIKCYIQLNYHKDITLKSVADMYYINPSYLSYLFSKKTNVTFWNYVTNIRVEQAKILLEETDLSIRDISNKVGFNNEKSFYAVFKKVIGLSPGEFRKAL